MRAKDPGMRCRCKVVFALVRGKAPTRIVEGGLCADGAARGPAGLAGGGLGAKPRFSRVAGRSRAGGLGGLADRREDNGRPKITPAYQAELLRLVDQSPQEFGYRRPTWTQELL